MTSGTAGVWRIAAINEAGGWKDRTTVEDMDLAVRASLKGWKFVYLGDLQVFDFWFNLHTCLPVYIRSSEQLSIQFDRYRFRP